MSLSEPGEQGCLPSQDIYNSGFYESRKPLVASHWTQAWNKNYVIFMIH